MTTKKTLSKIRGWFPQEPYFTFTRVKVDGEAKQPPPIIPQGYNLSATKFAGALAIFWIILYGYLFFTIINLERYPISIVQIAAWIVAGSALGTISCAIVTKNQLKRVSKDYQFSTNVKDMVLLIVPTVLFFTFGFILSWSTILISVYAWGISIHITKCALFFNFEKRENLRLMQSWWGMEIYLVPKAPQSQLNRHGEMLNFFLVAGIVGCVLAAFGYVAVGLLLLGNVTGGLGGVLSRLPIPLWTLTFYPILAIVNACALVALYRWRKWGFYVLLASSLTAFTVNIAFLGFRLEFIAGLFGITIIYILLRPKWSLLKPGYPPIRKYLSLALAILGVILLISSLSPTFHLEDRQKLVPQGETVASNRFTIDRPLPDTEIAANLTTIERLYFEIIIAKVAPRPYGNSSVAFTISNESLSSGNPKQVIFTNDQIGLQGDYYMHWSPLQNGTYYFTLHYNYSGLNQIWYYISKGWNTLEPVQVPVYTLALAMWTAPMVILGAALLTSGAVIFVRKNRTNEELKVKA